MKPTVNRQHTTIMAQLQSGLPFWYLVTSSAIIASGSQPVNLTLDAETDFRWVGTLGRCSLDAVANIRPNNFSVQMSISGGGQNFSSGQVPQSLFCGVAENPFWLPSPIVMQARTILTFNIVNLDSGNANTVTLALFGYKIPRSV